MAEILLLGQQKESASGIRKILRQDGHRVNWLRTVENWRLEERRLQPDLVVATVESSRSVLDVQGPVLRGFPPPLLMVEHDAGPSHEPHLEERLVDRITSPFLGEELLGRIDALVRVRKVVRNLPIPELAAQPQDERSEPTPEGSKGAGALATRLTSMLGARISRLGKPLAPYLEVAARVAGWADSRDAFVPGHAERVTTFCSMIAEGLGLGEREYAALLRAAMLHDIGKVALPVEVLHQQEPLRESQLRLIRTHPKRGAALLRALDWDADVADAILYHHERPDGSGYYGKDSKHTPRAAQVLAVAEVYDAMTSSLLKETSTKERALAHLKAHKGERYDPDCVEALTDKLKPRRSVIPISRC